MRPFGPKPFIFIQFSGKNYKGFRTPLGSCPDPHKIWLLAALSELGLVDSHIISLSSSNLF